MDAWEVWCPVSSDNTIVAEDDIDAAAAVLSQVSEPHKLLGASLLR